MPPDPRFATALAALVCHLPTSAAIQRERVMTRTDRPIIGRWTERVLVLAPAMLQGPAVSCASLS